MRRAIFTLLLAALLAIVAALPAQAQRQPYGTNDFGGFRSVLPPGTDGVFNVTDYATFLGTGNLPAARLGPAPALPRPDVRDSRARPSAAIGKYFKNATFGVQAGQEERTYSPRAG